MPARVSILVIDDNPLILQCCRDVFAEEGYATVEAGNGTEGMAKISQGGFDVIITDLKMPGADGMEVLRFARDKEPGTPVIILTGFPTVPSAIESVKAGAFDYVCKPLTPDELVLVTNKALDHRRLLLQSSYYKDRAGEEVRIDNVIAGSKAMVDVLRQVRQVAPTDSTVLLVGESGTGKEVVARTIHACSGRSQSQFIVADCASFAPTVFESELFGHVKGAFTGATRSKTGLLEIADGGTLFLDEIGNVPTEIQVKLLRVLENHEYKPVGGTRAKTADVRLIAATNRDLKHMVEAGGFREDLFYRLNVFPITLPLLRERPADIPLLANHFLQHFAAATGKPIQGFSPEAMQVLLSHSWPGNVRELRNVIERVVILVEGALVESLYLPAEVGGDVAELQLPIPRDSEGLKEVKRKAQERVAADIEHRFLLAALERADWNVTQAAKETGLQRTYFQSLMRKRGIKRPRD
jgi:two-component system NtrC family response regulator